MHLHHHDDSKRVHWVPICPAGVPLIMDDSSFLLFKVDKIIELLKAHGFSQMDFKNFEYSDPTKIREAESHVPKPPFSPAKQTTLGAADLSAEDFPSYVWWLYNPTIAADLFSLLYKSVYCYRHFKNGSVKLSNWKLVPEELFNAIEKDANTDGAVDSLSFLAHEILIELHKLSELANDRESYFSEMLNMLSKNKFNDLSDAIKSKWYDSMNQFDVARHMKNCKHHPTTPRTKK